MTTVTAYGTNSPTEDLDVMHIDRRATGPNDINLEVLFCGVCHSDLHVARNDWGFSKYPVVPGHEIVGKVMDVGSKVTRYKTGDIVAVGCMVDSCRHCASCEAGLEQYCDTGLIGTYGAPDPRHNNAITYGGYSKSMVVDESYVLSIPANLDPKAAAPLLCAGITTWSPLRHWNVGKGDTVGIIGLGGLGHMGVKFAHALGANVTMITSSPNKADDALKLGADDVLISSDSEAMAAAANRFDFLLNTIPVGHDINPYISLLSVDGTMVIVGAFTPLSENLLLGDLVMKRRTIAGSIIGGIKETQEMLDFCGEHNVLPEVEIIKMQQINTAYERMLKNDIKYRFVIDMNSLAVNY